jgi:ubiquinone/menaquinone biosynthesis C-methylase UbiE
VNKENAIIVDIAKPYIERARKRGFKVILGDAETITINEKFNTIIISAVLEHVLNPEKLLLNVKKHMMKNAKMFIVVPYKEKIKPHPKYEFAHLRSIDETYVKKLAEKTGFKIIRIIPFMAQVPGQVVLPIVRLIQSYLSDKFLCKIFRPSLLFVELRLLNKKTKKSKYDGFFNKTLGCVIH